MKILSFDLSLTQTGVAFAEINDKNEVVKISTVSIVPFADEEKLIKDMGFLRSKHKIITKSGNTYWSYVLSQNEIVSHTEKKKRDVAVRNAINMAKRNSLAKQIRLLFDKVKPELILVERNESFNGILTTKLLAEARGILEGACSDVPIKQYSVSEIRKGINLVELTRNFVNKLAETGSPFPADITKSALKNYVEIKYNISAKNTDESDACMVIDCYLRGRGVS